MDDVVDTTSKNPEARLSALQEMFEIRHNESSTPPRSLTGEVRDRTIWGYWAQGYNEMPEFFKLCVGTWQRLNPHWDVRILQKSTVHEYLSEVELPNNFMQMLSHQTASDAVRLGLLSRYGGVWMDVNMILRTSLDDFCWREITSGKRAGAFCYHPFYGTEALGGQDFVESWFLASKPGNPFFIRWRDMFKELFHNRLDTEGILEHPLYEGIDLSGFERLNQQFSGSNMDFREYLAIHVMCHRLIEKEPKARAMWKDEFLKVDAASTAFRMQLDAEAGGMAAAQALISQDPRADELVEGIPLMKFTTPHYGPLLFLQRWQLEDRRTLLGRLLDPSPPSGGSQGSVSTGVSGSQVSSTAARAIRDTSSLRAGGMGQTRGFANSSGNLGFRHGGRAKVVPSIRRGGLLASVAAAAAVAPRLFSGAARQARSSHSLLHAQSTTAAGAGKDTSSDKLQQWPQRRQLRFPASIGLFKLGI
eukprot:TRINITY_DN23471_c1_g1_i1.p1 TRINITY_DN23471_c1_g1~~TRINITY_DN23471_c1_g1_i1.p1  ORF type:complete len:475 (-),score=77.37 TRINITY_DN23471_c1_g1_i1:158-1582(-)